MRLIIGLGNPGKEYVATRHNIGFEIIDLFAQKIGVTISKTKKNALIYKHKNFILAKPQTYMNLSGDAVKYLVNFFKIKNEDILIIFDDMDTNIGEIKVKQKGSAGGQNGMKDIIEKLGTNEINRIKIGIGRPKYKTKDYVLSHFDNLQKEKLLNSKIKSINLISCFLDGGYPNLIKKYSQK